MRGRTSAPPARVAEVPALAGVHRGHQHEFARVGYLAGCARDCELPVLHRLAEVVEYRPEFGELVQKQHAVVRQRHFPGLGVWPAARKPHAAYRVVRRSERPPEKLVFRKLRQPRGGVYAEDFEKFVEGRQGHYRRNALCYHALPRARGPDHQQVVPARHRDFHRPADLVLPLYVGEVRHSLRLLGQVERRFGRFQRFEFYLAAQKIHKFPQVSRGVGVNPVHEGGLSRGLRREYHAPLAAPAREQRERHAPADLPQRAREAQFARYYVVRKFRLVELPRRREDSERYGQVVNRPLLAYVARGEVYRHLGERHRKPAVGQRRRNAVYGFFHRRVRKPHDESLGLSALAGVHLYFDGQRLHAHERARIDSC